MHKIIKHMKGNAQLFEIIEFQFTKKFGILKQDGLS